MPELPGPNGRALQIAADTPQAKQILKALASEPRLRMLELLSDRLCNVSEISEALDIPLATANRDIGILEEAGARVVDVELPHTAHTIATYYLIATAEASSNLARFDGVRYGRRAEKVEDLADLYERSRSEGFGAEVKRRILLGTYVLSAGYYDAYYGKAQRVRTLIRRDFDRAFESCDLLLTPTSPETAFRLGAKSDDPLAMYLSDVFTVSANLAGLPALSLPCGQSEGLPVGLQLIGRPLDEATILRVGDAFERRTEHHLAAPPEVE